LRTSYPKLFLSYLYMKKKCTLAGGEGDTRAGGPSALLSPGPGPVLHGRTEPGYIHILYNRGRGATMPPRPRAGGPGSETRPGLIKDLIHQTIRLLILNNPIRFLDLRGNDRKVMKNILYHIKILWSSHNTSCFIWSNSGGSSYFSNHD
jgi:hypothetical protein